MLEELFSGCYLCRSVFCQHILRQASEFANFLLKKISLYRTLMFIVFYERQIAPELERQALLLHDGLKGLFQESDMQKSFNQCQTLLYQIAVVVAYVKSSLVGSKSSALI